jgi:ribosome-associated protein
MRLWHRPCEHIWINIVFTDKVLMTESTEKKNVQKLQLIIVDALEDVKAQNLSVFDTEHLSSLFERVIIASGTSNRQTKALAASVRDKVREAGFPKPRIEGEDNGEWIIVDCGPVVAHIMQPLIRDYYHLEDIWGEKPVKSKAEKSAAKKAAKSSAGKAAKTAEVKAPAKKAAATKVVAKKVVAKKVVTKTTSVGSAKEAVAKKTVAKKTATKPATKTVAAKKPAAKKAAAKTSRSTKA